MPVKMNKNSPIRNKSVDESCKFSPITIAKSPASESPQKNLTGPPRIIRDIIADLFNNIQRWNSLHIRGCALVKQIASIKADDPKSYSPQLEEYVDDLYAVAENLGGYNDLFEVLNNQTKAFAKLPQVDRHVFFSLDALSIAELVKNICDAYRREFQVKHFVLQNIAHAKSKNEVMFLAAYWTHQINISKSVTFKLESILVETGHRPIK